MRFIDLSHELKNNTLAYPGDSEFKLRNIHENKKDYSLYEVQGNFHTGTHIDAPFHFIANGKKVKSILLEDLIGNSNVFDISPINTNKEINLEAIPSLKKIVQKNISGVQETKNELEKIIILKTRWCDNWGSENYFTENPYISKEVAKILVENNISGLAIDSPSVDSFGENKIHKILLKNNIWIVENLTNMKQIKDGIYKAFFIPLNIDSEASFIRAFIETP